jgi:two-component system, chemotaxis family, chemotaxis protein CheY
VPKCILIVDDSVVIRRTLRRLFEATGWDVCGEAENGKQAIEKAQELQPDLVTLDLSMPAMNGLETARELRRMNPSVPLIMYTMFETPHLEREAAKSGCNAVINKAGSSQLLIDTIERLLRAAA